MGLDACRAVVGARSVKSDTALDGAHYLLGHTDHELRRLDIQGELYRDATLRAFRDAGIELGMRVLDIGCGTGDVSRAVATVVGESGSVLGIDRGEKAVEAARAWAQKRGLTNLDFTVSEIDEFHRPAGFDAVVGRFILMHQPDPARALASVVRSVRAGGVVCMIESYMDALLSGPHSFPSSPLYDEIVRWKGAVVAGAGADACAGGGGAAGDLRRRDWPVRVLVLRATDSGRDGALRPLWAALFADGRGGVARSARRAEAGPGRLHESELPRDRLGGQSRQPSIRGAAAQHGNFRQFDYRAEAGLATG